MKIRIMGTKKECELATQYYLNLQNDPNVVSVEVSRLYENRQPSLLFRLYVDIVYKSFDNTTKTAKKRKGKFYPANHGYTCDDCGMQTLVYEDSKTTKKRCFECSVKNTLQQVEQLQE